MRVTVRIALALATLLAIGENVRLIAGEAEPDVWTSDGVMGYFTGTFTPAKGAPMKAEGRVIGEGVLKGRTNPAYRVLVNTVPVQEGVQALRIELVGELAEGSLSLTEKALSGKWTGNLKKDDLVVEAKGDDGGKFDLTRTVCKSPTEGQKPPVGAIVLMPFEPGKKPSLDEWSSKKWMPQDDGSVIIRGSNRTVRQFGDVQLHVEFMVPYMPSKRGQERGNSGVYLQNLYEVQVLDSFGLPPRNNECGGLYSIAAPRVNACFPPLTWQTYDITFRAPRFDADGKVVKPATITVIHNGARIQEDLILPRGTEKRGPGGEVKAGPIQLQDHGNTLRYRNIWVVELKDSAADAGETKTAFQW